MENDISDSQFNELILEIDRDLRGHNIPIHRRAMEAVLEFQRRTGIHEIIFGGELLEDTPTYSQRIFKWYDVHYGDRQKKDWSVGTSLILIHGEPWKITFPLTYGETHLNIFDLISDFPQSLRQSIGEIDKEVILATFRHLESLIHRIEHAKNLPYIQEARNDIADGVRKVTKAPQNLPMAKWLFSQAAEKLIKCFQKVNGVNPAHHHNLKIHIDKAIELGLPEISDNIINELKCPGSARYGEYKVDSFEVVNAHDACWEIVDIVLTKINLK